MLQQNLANIEKRIKHSNSDYARQGAVMNKIRQRQNAGMGKDAGKTINRYIKFYDVRKLRVDGLLMQKQYASAIKLIEEGIKAAISKKEPAAATW